MNQITWSMMLVSAENLLRICPKGVMSKNMRRKATCLIKSGERLEI